MEQGRWYKSGKTLINEIRNSSPLENSAHIWYLGQHGFAISVAGIVIYIDVILNEIKGKDGIPRRNYPPPFTPLETQRVDYFFATHNHLDHLNLETIVPLADANPGTKFIVPKPCVSVLAKAGIAESRIIGVRAEESFELGNIGVFPVPAVHTKYIQDEAVKDENGDHFDLGFVIKASGLSFYHSGDTWITPRLVEILKQKGPLNFAMLPINGTDWERTSSGCIGNVNAMDAVKLASAVPVDLIIPGHYDMMPGNTENPAYFADCMYRHSPQKRFHICALGERFIYSDV